MPSPLRPAEGVTVYLDKTVDPPEIVLELDDLDGTRRCYFPDPADAEAVAEALMQLAAEVRKQDLASELVACAGAIVGYCQHCDDPIFELDDLDTWTRAREAGGEALGYFHGRCMYESGSDAPAGFWKTDDFAKRFRDAGINPRSVGRKSSGIPKLEPITAELRELDPEAWK